MPFKHFLSTSLDFERTYQLILQCLLNDRRFFKILTGLQLQSYTVQLEPLGSLFDIGIYDENETFAAFMISLIEVARKPFSAISLCAASSISTRLLGIILFGL